MTISKKESHIADHLSKEIFEQLENNDLDEALNCISEFYLGVANRLIKNGVPPFLISNSLVHITASAVTFTNNSNVFLPTEEEIQQEATIYFNVLKNIQNSRRSFINTSMSKEVH